MDAQITRTNFTPDEKRWGVTIARVLDIDGTLVGVEGLEFA